MSTAPKPDFEGIRNLAAIIDGMPSNRIYFGSISNKDNPTFRHMHECGTTACALGVVCIHPDFEHKGLKFRYGRLQLGGTSYRQSDYGLIGAQVFGISRNDARALFTSTYYEACTGEDDKQVFKRRVIKFLQKHGQPVSAAYMAGYEVPLHGARDAVSAARN